MSKSGYQSKCKDCCKAYHKDWVSKNPDKIRGLLKSWRERNPDYHNNFYEMNAEKYKVYSQKYYKNNKEKFYLANAIRHYRIKTHTLNLSDFQIALIRKIYKKARELTKQTGVQHHVDHIFPLKAGNSCGLHVPWNLRIIEAKENIKKYNKVPKNVPATAYLDCPFF